MCQFFSKKIEGRFVENISKVKKSLGGFHMKNKEGDTKGSSVLKDLEVRGLHGMTKVFKSTKL